MTDAFLFDLAFELDLKIDLADLEALAKHRLLHPFSFAVFLA